MKLPISKLAALAQKDRTTVRARLEGLPCVDGPKNGRHYDSRLALPRIFQTKLPLDVAAKIHADGFAKIRLVLKKVSKDAATKIGEELSLFELTWKEAGYEPDQDDDQD